MLVEPASGVFRVRLVEGLRSQYAPEGDKHGGRLVVAGDTVGAVGRIPVAVTHQLDLTSALGEVEIVPAIALLVIEALEEIGHGLRLIELGEPLVHPGVPLLVRADQHGEPHVPDLVGRDLVQPERVPLSADAGHHRVLHPATRRWTVHRRHVRIGVRQQVAGEELHRVPAIARAFLPVAGPQLGTVEGIDRRGIGTAVTVRVADGGVGRIPEIPGRGSPGDVAHAVRPEAPGELAVDPHRGRGACTTVGFRHHPHYSSCVTGRVQAIPGLGGQDLARVDQPAGGSHQPTGRQRQGHVVVAIPHVELGVPQVLVGLPAVDVVIHRHLGVPVVDEERLAVLATPGSTVGWNPELPGEVECG